jgi:DtxR family Mn-dependent transcriptional regulator
MTDNISESVEMYLQVIATLRRNGSQAVPLSLLAKRLAILPASVNEMCRKLAYQGLVDYQPYKGVTLTDEGETLAQGVLCRRRIWEVFLVEKLGFSLEEAEEIACELEHATPDQLLSRLAAYLDFPTLSPRNEPIPCDYRGGTDLPLRDLTRLDAGQSGQVVNVAGDEVIKQLLRGYGISRGVVLEVLAVKANESMLLEVGGQCLSLAWNVATQVEVVPTESEQLPDVAPRGKTEGQVAGSDIGDSSEKEKDMETEVSQITLDQLPVGRQGVIVRLGGGKAIKRRLLDMGLVTGETVTLKAVAPMGDPLEFMVKGYKLSLRKSEAKDILVEVMDDSQPPG